MQIRVSVVIATYNRANTLLLAIRSLLEQTLGENLFEIIVVDNNSTDKTSKVVKIFQKNHKNFNIILLHEIRQGVSYARTTGANKARGDYVAFMDDDCRTCRNWLKNIKSCIERVHPQPTVIGGPIYPLYEYTKPAWFKDEYEIRTWGEKPRFLGPMEVFSGGNLIIQREMIKRLGGLNVDLGPRGEYFGMHEDTEYQRQIWGQNNESVFYYSPKLVMYHLVPKFKMNVSYPLKRAFIAGQCSAINSGRMLNKGRVRYLWFRFRDIFFSFRQILHSRREYSTSYKNWIFEKWTGVASDLGRCLAKVGFVIKLKQGKH